MSYYVKKPLGTKIIVKSHFVVPPAFYHKLAFFVEETIFG
jgi:hypothetical protein